MKKLILAFAVLACIATKTQAQVSWINASNASYNFLAPSATYSTTEGKYEVVFPYYDVQTSTDSLTSALTIKHQYTFVTYAQLDTNITISLTINSQLKAGATLYILTESNATARTTTFNTSQFIANAVAGVINKKKLHSFVYNGSKFVHISSTQIN